MLLWSTTKHENGQTIPLLGGERAVRPWGGLWSREQDPPRRSAPAPPEEGIFMGDLDPNLNSREFIE